VSDDPNSVADALDAWSDVSNVFEDTDDDRQILATAARLLRESADTADRLAVAEAAHLATYETVSRRADAAEARLAALTDAIDTAEQNPPDFDGYLPREAWEAAFTRITDAAAVQPPDTKEPI